MTIIPLPVWAIFLVGLLLILPGCATKEEPRSEVCFLQLLGRTQDGLSVVASQCVSPEAFAESQK